MSDFNFNLKQLQIIFEKKLKENKLLMDENAILKKENKLLMDENKILKNKNNTIERIKYLEKQIENYYKIKNKLINFIKNEFIIES